MPLKSGPRSNADAPRWATPLTDMERPRVAIVIVNWNEWRHTMECLESLRSVTYPDFKIFVVDTGSGRDDVLLLRNWQSGGTLIENDTNLGFSGGNNVGIRRALASPDAAYVLILNNDTIVEPAFLSEMIATAQGHPADMVSPKILDYGDRKTVDRLGIILT